MSVKLPHKAKPSKVVSKDETRPQLQQAILMQNGDDWTLMATDSYRLLSLPVEVDGADEPGPISREAITAAEKTGRFAAGEYVEPLTKTGGQNGGLLFRRPKPAKAEEPIPKWTTLEWPAEPKPKDKLTIGFNARFLFEVAQAIGATRDSVRVTLDLSKTTDDPDGKKYLKAYVITGEGTEGRALLMPIRVL